MVTSPPRMPSFITDEDERLLMLLQADPEARQLLSCFASLPQEDRQVVSRMALAYHEAHPALVAVPPYHARPLGMAR